MKIKHAFLTVGILSAVILTAIAFFPTATTSAAPSGVYESIQDGKLSPQELTGTYNFDKAHSNIGFRVLHMGLAEVPGNFTDFTGTINYDGADVTKSSVEFSAKVTSVNTGVQPRDNHLRTADFFEVEKYPDMMFKSTRIEKKGNNQFIAHGDFTLKGVTKQIALPVTINGYLKDQRGNVKIGISALTTINRSDYGVGKVDTLPNGAQAIADKININLQIEAGKAAPKPAEATTTK